MPYEKYESFISFYIRDVDIQIADSVMKNNGINMGKIEFAQYSGFIDQLGNRVIYINYIFDIEGKNVDRCKWLFGLGDYFENNTIQGYVDLSKRKNYDVL